MSKKFSLSIIILSIIEAICCFVPFCFKRKLWKYVPSITYHGASSLVSSKNISAFGVTNALGRFLAILFICAALIVVAIYLLRLLNKEYVILKSGWIFSNIHTIIMVFFLIYVCGFAEDEIVAYKHTYEINWLFFVIIALNVISLILSIVLKFGRTQANLERFIKEPTSPQLHSLDALKEYKGLLDLGILTQEEFERKKKEILDM